MHCHATFSLFFFFFFFFVVEMRVGNLWRLQCGQCVPYWVKAILAVPLADFGAHPFRKFPL